MKNIKIFFALVTLGINVQPLRAGQAHGCVSELHELVKHSNPQAVGAFLAPTVIYTTMVISANPYATMQVPSTYYPHDVNERDSDRYTALHWACTQNSVDMAKVLVENFADVNAKAKSGETPIFHALRSKTPEIVKFLVKSGASVKVKTSGGETPLFEAIQSSTLEIINLLIGNGADVKAENKNGKTPLELLSVKNELLDQGTSQQRAELCILLMKRGIKNIETYIMQFMKGGLDFNTCDVDGNTPLHVACQKGFFSIANLFVENGADATVKNKRGKTAIDLLALKGFSEERTEFCLSLFAKNGKGFKAQIKQLVQSGLNVKTQDSDGKTLLHWACKNGFLDIVKLLVEKGAEIWAKDGDDYTPLHLACSQDDCSIVTFLIEKGAVVNARTGLNYHTPLHASCHFGSLEIVKLLIANGAELDAKDKYDETPLYWACQSGHLDIAGMLIEKGATVTIKSQSGNVPFDLLTLEQRTKLCVVLLKRGCRNVTSQIKELIKRGVYVDVQDNENYCTLLHLASDCGLIEVAELLLEKNANIDVRDKNGETPLLLACKKGHLGLVELLIEKGADINVKNKCDETPLHVAYKNGFLGIGSLLVEKGADVKVSNKDGKTSIDLLGLQDCASQYRALLVMLLMQKGHKNRAALIQLLTQKDFDITAQDGDENTVLHYACANRYLDIVKFLISNDIDVTIKNKEGYSPLDLLDVTVKERAEICLLLLQKGNKDLEPQIKLLIEGGNIPINLLGEQGTLKECIELCVLLSLKKNKSLEYRIKLLIQGGLDVNTKDDDSGNTLLHWACKNDCLDVAKLLLETKASATIENKNGKTPLDLLKSDRRLKLGQLLNKNGYTNSSVLKTLLG